MLKEMRNKYHSSDQVKWKENVFTNNNNNMNGVYILKMNLINAFG